MEKKYKVTPYFMIELKKWRDDYDLNANNGGIFSFADERSIEDIQSVVETWWKIPDNPIENNNRLIAIIRWLNGEDVFEVEKQHRFVVRSEKNDDGGEYTYVFVESGMPFISYYFHSATKFDTREEAQEWANSHQVVVEIDADGNEVE